MEIHTLLDLPKPVAELTDAELEKHLTKFFPFTRPKKPMNYIMAQATSVSTATTHPVMKGSLRDKLNSALAAEGIKADGTLENTKISIHNL